MTAADRDGPLLFEQAAAVVTRKIADGALRPGQPAPSAAALSRETGLSTWSCRRALQALLERGALVPGPSRQSRPRIAGYAPQGPAGRAAAVLSASLAARRRAARLTQEELAALTGYSVTTVCHAETSRTWQAAQFWEQADAALSAGGALLALHDAYRQAATAEPGPQAEGDGKANAPPAPASMVIFWTDGAMTTVPLSREAPRTA